MKGFSLRRKRPHSGSELSHLAAVAPAARRRGPAPAVGKHVGALRASGTGGVSRPPRSPPRHTACDAPTLRGRFGEPEGLRFAGFLLLRLPAGLRATRPRAASSNRIFCDNRNALDLPNFSSPPRLSPRQAQRLSTETGACQFPSAGTATFGLYRVKGNGPLKSTASAFLHFF